MINPETAGKDRAQYQRALIIALRELMGQSAIDARTYDLLAFIVLMLQAIDATIELSVAAWEKRGYWVKADRFRLQWSWAGTYGHRLRTFLMEENWPEAAILASQITAKLAGVKVPVRNRLGTPWVGAWKELSKSLTEST